MNLDKQNKVQALLLEKGVLDVKFLFSREARAAYVSDVKDDVADVLTKYFDGEYTKLADFSDEIVPKI